MGRRKPFANHVAIFLSLTIALCWVAHPLNTESVTYITQRNESLMSLFLLLTIYAVERGSSSQYKLYLLRVGCAGLCAWYGNQAKYGSSPSARVAL